MGLTNTLRLPPLPSVRDILKLYRLRGQRELSQNFLLDQRITDRIVSAAGRIRDDFVCEVGPGPGSITRSILRHCPRQLVVVEKDKRFLPMLFQLQTAMPKRNTLMIDLIDVREFSFEKNFPFVTKTEWLADTPPNLHILGNLPFNISTHLLITWLEDMTLRRGAWSFGRTPLTLTFQKEVAQRIVAVPGQPCRCRLSVISQLYCDVSHKFTISGGAFVPKPDVDVGVVTLLPLKYPLVHLPFVLVEKLLRTVFNVKGKPIHFSIARLFPENIRTDLTGRLFQISDIYPNTIATELTNEDFVRLLYGYKVLCEQVPNIELYDFRASKVSREIVETCF